MIIFSEFSLSREQKAIIVLGYGGGLISANDIWNTLGLQDTEDYRKLLVSLRELGILTTEVSRQQAQKIRSLRKVNGRDIPRFGIQIPTPGCAEGQTDARSVRVSVERYPDRPIRQQLSKEGMPPVQPRTRRGQRYLGYRERSDRFDTAARLYLGNLSADVRASDLIGFLMHKDMDADVTIPNDFGRGRGYAFAQFNSPEAAKAAIEALDGVEFQGRRLVARPALRALRRPFSM